MKRYFFKQTTVVTCYDRVTGQVIGDTLDDRRIRQDTLDPRGLDINERCGPGTAHPVAKIQLDMDDAYHKAVFQARFGEKLR